jgi:hypothetical protein
MLDVRDEQKDPKSGCWRVECGLIAWREERRLLFDLLKQAGRFDAVVFFTVNVTDRCETAED